MGDVDLREQALQGGGQNSPGQNRPGQNMQGGPVKSRTRRKRARGKNWQNKQRLGQQQWVDSNNPGQSWVGGNPRNPTQQSHQAWVGGNPRGAPGQHWGSWNPLGKQWVGQNPRAPNQPCVGNKNPMGQQWMGQNPRAPGQKWVHRDPPGQKGPGGKNKKQWNQKGKNKQGQHEKRGQTDDQVESFGVLPSTLTASDQTVPGPSSEEKNTQETAEEAKEGSLVSDPFCQKLLALVESHYTEKKREIAVSRIAMFERELAGDSGEFVWTSNQNNDGMIQQVCERLQLPPGSVWKLQLLRRVLRIVLPHAKASHHQRAKRLARELLRSEFQNKDVPELEAVVSVTVKKDDVQGGGNLDFAGLAAVPDQTSQSQELAQPGSSTQRNSQGLEGVQKEVEGPFKEGTLILDPFCKKLLVLVKKHYSQRKKWTVEHRIKRFEGELSGDLACFWRNIDNNDETIRQISERLQLHPGSVWKLQLLRRVVMNCLPRKDTAMKAKLQQMVREAILADGDRFRLNVRYLMKVVVARTPRFSEEGRIHYNNPQWGVSVLVPGGGQERDYPVLVPGGGQERDYPVLVPGGGQERDSPLLVLGGVQERDYPAQNKLSQPEDVPVTDSECEGLETAMVMDNEDQEQQCEEGQEKHFQTQNRPSSVKSDLSMTGGDNESLETPMLKEKDDQEQQSQEGQEMYSSAQSKPSKAEDVPVSDSKCESLESALVLDNEERQCEEVQAGTDTVLDTEQSLVTASSVESHVASSAESHVASSAESHVASSAVSHVASSAESHVASSAESHMASSVESHVASSAVSHVASSAVPVSQVVSSAADCMTPSAESHVASSAESHVASSAESHVASTDVSHVATSAESPMASSPVEHVANSAVGQPEAPLVGSSDIPSTATNQPGSSSSQETSQEPGEDPKEGSQEPGEDAKEGSQEPGEDAKEGSQEPGEDAKEGSQEPGEDAKEGSQELATEGSNEDGTEESLLHHPFTQKLFAWTEETYNWQQFKMEILIRKFDHSRKFEDNPMKGNAEFVSASFGNQDKTIISVAERLKLPPGSVWKLQLLQRVIKSCLPKVRTVAQTEQFREFYLNVLCEEFGPQNSTELEEVVAARFSSAGTSQETAKGRREGMLVFQPFSKKLFAQVDKVFGDKTRLLVEGQTTRFERELSGNVDYAWTDPRNNDDEFERIITRLQLPQDWVWKLQLLRRVIVKILPKKNKKEADMGLKLCYKMFRFYGSNMRRNIPVLLEALLRDLPMYDKVRKTAKRPQVFGEQKKLLAKMRWDQPDQQSGVFAPEMNQLEETPVEESQGQTGPLAVEVEKHLLEKEWERLAGERKALDYELALREAVVQDHIFKMQHEIYTHKVTQEVTQVVQVTQHAQHILEADRCHGNPQVSANHDVDYRTMSSAASGSHRRESSPLPECFHGDNRYDDGRHDDLALRDWLPDDGDERDGYRSSYSQHPYQEEEERSWYRDEEQQGRDHSWERGEQDPGRDHSWERGDEDRGRAHSWERGEEDRYRREASPDRYSEPSYSPEEPAGRYTGDQPFPSPRSPALDLPGEQSPDFALGDFLQPLPPTRQQEESLSPHARTGIHGNHIYDDRNHGDYIHGDGIHGDHIQGQGIYGDNIHGDYIYDDRIHSDRIHDDQHPHRSSDLGQDWLSPVSSLHSLELPNRETPRREPGDHSPDRERRRDHRSSREIQDRDHRSSSESFARDKRSHSQSRRGDGRSSRDHRSRSSREDKSSRDHRTTRDHRSSKDRSSRDHKSTRDDKSSGQRRDRDHRSSVSADRGQSRDRSDRRSRSSRSNLPEKPSQSGQSSQNNSTKRKRSRSPSSRSYRKRPEDTRSHKHHSDQQQQTGNTPKWPLQPPAYVAQQISAERATRFQDIGQISSSQATQSSASANTAKRRRATRFEDIDQISSNLVLGGMQSQDFGQVGTSRTQGLSQGGLLSWEKDRLEGYVQDIAQTTENAPFQTDACQPFTRRLLALVETFGPVTKQEVEKRIFKFELEVRNQVVDRRRDYDDSLIDNLGTQIPEEHHWKLKLLRRIIVDTLPKKSVEEKEKILWLCRELVPPEGVELTEELFKALIAKKVVVNPLLKPMVITGTGAGISTRVVRKRTDWETRETVTAYLQQEGIPHTEEGVDAILQDEELLSHIQNTMAYRQLVGTAAFSQEEQQRTAAVHQAARIAVGQVQNTMAYRQQVGTAAFSQEEQQRTAAVHQAARSAVGQVQTSLAMVSRTGGFSQDGSWQDDSLEGNFLDFGKESGDSFHRGIRQTVLPAAKGRETLGKESSAGSVGFPHSSASSAACGSVLARSEQASLCQTGNTPQAVSTLALSGPSSQGPAGSYTGSPLARSDQASLRQTAGNTPQAVGTPALSGPSSAGEAKERFLVSYPLPQKLRAERFAVQKPARGGTLILERFAQKLLVFVEKNYGGRMRQKVEDRINTFEEELKNPEFSWQHTQNNDGMIQQVCERLRLPPGSMWKLQLLRRLVIDCLPKKTVAGRERVLTMCQHVLFDEGVEVTEDVFKVVIAMVARNLQSVAMTTGNPTPPFVQGLHRTVPSASSTVGGTSRSVAFTQGEMLTTVPSVSVGGDASVQTVQGQMLRAVPSGSAGGEQGLDVDEKQQMVIAYLLSMGVQVTWEAVEGVLRNPQALDSIERIFWIPHQSRQMVERYLREMGLPVATDTVDKIMGNPELMARIKNTLGGQGAN
ncbi:uncharacterized protein LOC144908514 [Branchiostoma floridae x Branchiostoma belcheri]